MTDVEETASCSAIRSDGRPIGRMTGNASVILQGKASDHTDGNSASARLEPRANVIVLSLKAPITMKKPPHHVACEGVQEKASSRVETSVLPSK